MTYRDIPATCCMFHYCHQARTLLSKLKGRQWAEAWVELRLEFQGRYGKGLIMSTAHGIDFFQNVLNGPEVWDEKGEYGDNFRKLFK